MKDGRESFAATGCDAVMTSEAALENPSMLAGVPTSRSGQAAVTREYIALARAHPPRAVAVLKAHLFKLLFLALEANRDLRDRLGAVMSAEGFGVVAAAML
jgi:tRNA-dihydrouridine synthase